MFDLGTMLRSSYQKVEDNKILEWLDFDPEQPVD